jgi:diguanylate cyclase (GGDEF)-like protein/PAS domain S-box-containing protein
VGDTGKIKNLKIDLTNVVDKLSVPTFVIAVDHTVLAWNRSCEILTGIKSEDIVGTKDSWRGFYNTQRPCLVDIVVDNAESGLGNYYPVYGKSKFGEGLHAESWFYNINGKRRYLIFDAEPIYDEDGVLIAGVENLEDITEIKQVEERLMLSDKVFSYTNQSILITDSNQRIVQVNQAFTELTGYHLDEVVGKSPGILESGRHDEKFFKEMEEELVESGHWEGEIWDKRKDGTIYPKWLSITTVLDPEDHQKVTHYIAIFTDITERKKSEEEVRHIAFHDALTQLPNRMLFYDRLERALKDAKREKTKVALMFIDLDRFKIVNDTLGHHIGDLLLQEVAERLKLNVRNSDTVARLGGDEFVIILPDIARARDVSKVATKLLDKLNLPIIIDENELYTTPSIGISLYPTDGETVETLMQTADTAMYHVKEAGKNNFQYFTQAMTQAAQARASLEKDLRVALDKAEFSLYYQPKLRVNPLSVVGCEALIRWNHPEHGFVPPDVFIPVAEEIGMILPLGEWIINEATQQVASWRQKGLFEFGMAINLSPAQFKDEKLAKKIQNRMKLSALEPGMLEFEITETILMDNIQATSEGLVALKKLGVTLAIDDFGTGYSSLSYLKSFDIDTLKIDKSFIDDIHVDSDNAEIVSAVMSLSHNLGLTVVAEGVETEEQQNLLADLGCDVYQGYLFSKPLPADEFFEYVKKQNKI